MEEIWSLDNNMDQLTLKRLEDGTFMFQASQQGEYGTPTVFPDRKNLKDLHSAIEQELWPERYLPPVPRKTNYDDLFIMMNNLGIPEEKINQIIDELQVKEYEQRTD